MLQVNPKHLKFFAYFLRGKVGEKIKKRKRPKRGEISLQEFEKLYLEYYRRVYAFLYKMCKDKELCEDMTQETFFAAYKSFHKYNGTCTVFTFLAAIAKNIYFKYMRKNKVTLVDIDFLGDSAVTHTSPETEFFNKNKCERVRKCIDTLPSKYKDVVVLRTYADLAFSDIANLLNISENSAKVIYHRAKKILKEALLDEQ